MTWKIKLTSSITDSTLVIGRKWLKKNLKGTDLYPSACEQCNGTVHGLSSGWKTFDDLTVFVCFNCGFLHKSAPKVTVKKQPVTKKKKKAKVEPKKAVSKPKGKKPAEKAEPAKDAAKIKVNEIKGIGKATAEQLTMVGIKTAADLLNLDSKAIADKIGRKSDTQIKKWQDNAKASLES
ncbi:MAG: hypothetical protein ACXADA_12760 [Candidatus Hodarchaeales archaeon]